MIRLNLVLLMAVVQAVFAERLVLRLATGGRGMVLVANLAGPWIMGLLVVLPYWREVRATFSQKQFVAFWFPFIALFCLLPVAGVALGGYPLRTAYNSWEATNILGFLSVGAVGALRFRWGARTARRYLVFAILVQLAMAVLQTAAQFRDLPGFLGSVYDWDQAFKTLWEPDNTVLARASGFYLNPNSLGIWAHFALWSSFFFLQGWQRRLGCLAAVATILLCQSRGTLAACLASAGCYGIVWMFRRAGREQRLRGTLALCLGAVPVLVLALPGLAASLPERLRGVPVLETAVERFLSGAKVLTEGASADANFQGRTQFWRVAMDYLASHPFGTLGSPDLVLKVPSDNQYVAALAQGGLFYLGALLLLFLGGIRLLASPWAEQRCLGVTTLALCVNGVSAVPFAYPASFPYWILVGAALGGAIGRGREAHS